MSREHMSRKKWICKEDKMRKFVDGAGLCIFDRKIQKSIRMDRDIYYYIMQISGKNFSDSLENLVLDHARLTGHLKDVT